MRLEGWASMYFITFSDGGSSGSNRQYIRYKGLCTVHFTTGITPTTKDGYLTLC